LYSIDDPKKIRMFLEEFEIQRKTNRERDEEDVDYKLEKYSFNLQQAIGDTEHLRENKDLLISRYLEKFPDTPFKDPRRHYTHEERVLIWVRGSKKCELCNTSLELSEMDADHNREWNLGGQTTLANARCLCQSCNRSRPNAT